MPIFKSNQKAPAWSLIKNFQICKLDSGEKVTIKKEYSCEVIVSVFGECLMHLNGAAALCHNGYEPAFAHLDVDDLHLRNDPFTDIPFEGRRVRIRPDTCVDISDSPQEIEVEGIFDHTVFVRVAGTWNREDYAGIGTFLMNPAGADSKAAGDPLHYEGEINTILDNHYHDFDEYWIFVSGEGTAISEDNVYSFKSGDCLATGTGYFHHLPYLTSPLKAVYLEGNLEGKRRRGHLNTAEHGRAIPSGKR